MKSKVSLVSGNAHGKGLFHIVFLVVMAMVSILPLSAQKGNAAVELQNIFRNISREVLPVVVEVNVTNIISGGQSQNFFDFFFPFRRPDKSEPQDQEPSFRQQGFGSGVIVERKGNVVYVLTNSHVVDTADEIDVKLFDDREFKGKLVGKDELRDLALVSFETKESLPVATLGNSDEVHVGDWVLAIGKPLGLESTVTAGIISAKGRVSRGPGFTDYLQTDAAINRGNSGGPLVNIKGEVIGINTFIVASGGGGSIGLGFAIPINNAVTAIRDFIEKGTVEYAWLGVNMANVDEIIDEEMKLKGRKGAFVHNVYVGSPAMKADIRPGDLIVQVKNSKIINYRELVNSVASARPGDRVPVTVVRNGDEMRLFVRLAVRTIERDDDKLNAWPGFSVIPLTKEVRKQMDIDRRAGNVFIGAVIEGSEADTLGLQGQDVIKSVNKRNVRNLKHFYELINSRGKVNIRVNRDGEQLSFVLER